MRIERGSWRRVCSSARSAPRRTRRPGWLAREPSLVDRKNVGLKDLVKSRKDEIRPGAYAPSRNKLLGPRGEPVPDSEELQRILALPRRPPVDLESDMARA